MMRLAHLSLLFLCCCATSLAGDDLSTAEVPTIHHRIEVDLDPTKRRLSVVDEISLPKAPSGPLLIQLHPGLQPRVLEPGLALERTRLPKFAGLLDSNGDAEPSVEYYLLRLPPQQRSFTLQYAGEIDHPVRQYGEEYARSFGASPGIISSEGVFLSGTSYWYPHLGDTPVTFDLWVRLPTDWRSVSQGTREIQGAEGKQMRERWQIELPQEEIYLIAAPYTEYRQAAGPAEAMVFLRQPDAGLAQQYLDATAQYLAMYRQLLGPYPYRKFALVENFWETGYGMPSFTLLGPRVIRFPFILRSSYPHEILHNWWGNGVYVDYANGNWSEGLTSYLADHLIQEQRGRGAEYRRSSLQKYADYVSSERDFPLHEFRSRHSSATQAVGYSKSLMLFHMLRRQLGDPAFIAGLRSFYSDHRFQVAGFADLERSFSAAAGRPLGDFFAQWVTRMGAPALRLRAASAEPMDGAYRLRLLIEQVQKDDSYRLAIPLAIHLQGEDRAYQTTVELTQRREHIELALPGRPWRVDLDPEFDLFRQLERAEIPPAISQAFGARRALIVLPAASPRALLESYRQLAESWQAGRANELEIRLDRELEELPQDRAVWLFGWDNRFRPQVAGALADYPFTDLGDRVRIADADLARDRDSIVVLARAPENPDQALAWVASDDPAAVPGLGRKLPHYGKYSFLGFRGAEPTNHLKGQWPVVDSPLSILVEQMDGVATKATPGELAPRAPLVELPPSFSAERMREDAERLSAPDMEGRGLGTQGLERAADYVAQRMQAAGLEPGGEPAGEWFQTWRQRTGPEDRELSLRNVVGVIPGSRRDWAGESVVIAAHYDHLGRGWPDVHRADRGKIHPGADDNASGVAVLLELARHFAGTQPERSLVFVAFTGEEAGRIGSQYYVQHPPDFPTDQCIGMLNLDTVGRLGQRDLLVLGTGSAREWEHIFRGAGYVTGVGLKTVSDEFGASDQRSFLDAGIAAIQLFAGPHASYHRASDTVEKLDLAGMLKTAAVLKEAVHYLAARPDPLTTAQEVGEPNTAAAPAAEGRRVTLGTVPDFAFAGVGVRLSGTTPDSPAARAGMRSGDIIIGINQDPVRDLRDFARILRSFETGDEIRVRLLRGHEEHSVATELITR